MPSHLIPCPAPSADELATLTAERPVRIDGNFVHRFRDARGHVRYENMDGTLKGLGISLTEMAQTHAQSLRAYLETIRKARLHNMLLRIQKPQQFSTGRLPGVILPS